MQQVTFDIKRLGAIRDSSMTLSPMMIFSGESGLGKSYASFLVHYLYYVLLDSDRFLNFFLEQGYDFNEIYKKRESGKVILSVPVQDVLDWLNKDAVAYIGYLVGYQNLDGDVNIKLPIQEKTFDFIFTQTLEGLEGQEELYDKLVFKNYVYRVVSTLNIPTPIPYVTLIKAYFQDLVFGDMNNITKTFLLPPSRGSLMEVSERPTFQSGMYEEFFDMKALLNKPQESVSPLNQALIECNARVNNGELKREGEKYLYHMRNGATIPLTAAASSIKELSPLSLLINKFPVKGVSILFEEPEAHLHPSRQVKLADLLACIISAGGHLQVTTHSDYLIKRLNNLMKLSLLKDKISPSDFEKLLNDFQIKEEYLLAVSNVRAYLLEEQSDGSSRIIAQEVGKDNSIPFESFYSVIEDDLELTSRIEEIMDSLES
ncbi:AAA family ATPase [Porphyromonas vaginalis]|uniref:AAA family ATPase n=1 Tax=Porphyromonas vaginalis TaxID=3044325 RepID=UPI00260C1C29|nr:AAA family ATPase [Porphyromonas vaginalis]